MQSGRGLRRCGCAGECHLHVAQDIRCLLRARCDRNRPKARIPAGIEEIATALQEQAEAGRAFVLILGPSGSGKTSVVQAGVIPWLCSNRPALRLNSARIVLSRGRQDPWHALASAFTRRSPMLARTCSAPRLIATMARRCAACWPSINWSCSSMPSRELWKRKPSCRPCTGWRAAGSSGLIVCGPLRTLLHHKEMAFLLEPPRFAADDAYA